MKAAARTISDKTPPTKANKKVLLEFFSTSFYVSLKHFDNANAGAIKTNVKDGVLFINSNNFDWHRVCSRWCIPDTFNMVVTVSSPNIPQVNFPDGSGKATFMGPGFYR